MLTLQMLPATCGDCLWLEYGTGAAKRVVIIDGGLTETATTLRQRIEKARRERGIATLEVELLVVTHIDNDHILGIIELLKAESPGRARQGHLVQRAAAADGLARRPSRPQRRPAQDVVGRSGGPDGRCDSTPTRTGPTSIKRRCRPRQTCSDRSRATSSRSC